MKTTKENFYEAFQAALKYNTDKNIYMIASESYIESGIINNNERLKLYSLGKLDKSDIKMENEYCIKSLTDVFTASGELDVLTRFSANHYDKFVNALHNYKNSNVN